MANRAVAGTRSRYQVERVRQRRRDFVAWVAVGALPAPVLAGALWILSRVDLHVKRNFDVLFQVNEGWTAERVGAALERNDVVSRASAFTDLAAAQNVTTFTP